ncbi:NAD(P)-dependent dehydrogenase (short-subunit alcohol dehydrogenase family) [Xanthomonas arboricola]|uniref:SDR family NAD(P)-dependent oxidoreductase n=1 Tax=Xanthomonas cannabis TaxID=1885674 RepID=UPI001622978B|nr:SDR family NAD(P)-dependent oxidoreductase [Xanthomonas cannabis]MBB3801915.1 NAD(P)-dependent dehydrogenase (short-subunit alcohol dehydrogenase family) [Xanthomonas cannabis]
MQKVIVIFGAGTGLGLAVGRRFGKEGYAVALVARRLQPLEALVVELAAGGVAAAPFLADLAIEGQVRDVVSQIAQHYGRIDAIYYSPATADAFHPASAMTSTMFDAQARFLFLGLVASVQASLPYLRESGGGAILAAYGGTAALGLPFMCGPAPAQAAVRNYLQSLQGELQPEGIHVAMASISAVIRGSAYHQQVEAGDDDAPEGLEMEIVDPEEIAEDLWSAVFSGGGLEFSYPRNSA